ncbi:MAG: alpha/beta hydrolase [Deltaproteobacteria bacterium]|nr:alpha/beta hydrolase [Deltaproteobacteria bacterium]
MNDQPARRTHALPGRNVQLALLDWGGNDPLAFFTHATGFCASTLSPIAEQLHSHYHVIGHDHRGHGHSTKLLPPYAYQWEELVLDIVAAAKALVREHRVSQVSLGVGHSVGANCLLAAAARSPGLFGKLALVDPVVMPPVGERTGFYAGEGVHPLAEMARRRRAVFASREEAQQQWATRGTFSDWDARALASYLEDGFRDRSDGQVELQCAPEVEAALHEAGLNFHIFSEVAQLRTPTTLFHAAHSPFRWDLIERLAARSDYVTAVSIEGDHLVPMTDPDMVAAQLLKL